MLSSSAVPRNQIVSRAEWLAARRALLVHEKQATRLRDQVNAERLALPRVRVKQDYVFDTQAGRRSLAELVWTSHRACP